MTSSDAPRSPDDGWALESDNQQWGIMNLLRSYSFSNLCKYDHSIGCGSQYFKYNLKSQSQMCPKYFIYSNVIIFYVFFILIKLANKLEEIN